MATVSRERLVELEHAIFDLGQGTVEDAAAGFARDELIATIRAARQAMQHAISGLPDSAFAQQVPDERGDPVWSAGEIVAHITESMLWLQFAFRRLAGEAPEGEPADKLEIAVRDRDATVALLDRADRELELAFRIAADLSDEPRTDIDSLGGVGVRGLLLLHAMHEWEHTNQVVELGDDCP